MLSAQKPNSIEEASFNTPLSFFSLVLMYLNYAFIQYDSLLMQLEKIIGKLKTEKYGSRILEEISKYDDSDELKERGNKERATKRPKVKTKKAVVVIESSDEDA